MPLSAPGSVIVADNVIRAAAVADPGDDDPRVVGIRRFHELVGADPRLWATALQTVGAKGHAGFALIVVGDPGRRATAGPRAPRARG